MARSIEWSGPLRKRCIMPQHMMPQRSVPITSQNITLTGSTLRPRKPEFKAHLARELEHKVWPLIENGSVKIIIDKVFPLDQAADAHRHMEAGTHMGKIVLQV